MKKFNSFHIVTIITCLINHSANASTNIEMDKNFQSNITAIMRTQSYLPNDDQALTINTSLKTPLPDTFSIFINLDEYAFKNITYFINLKDIRALACVDKNFNKRVHVEKINLLGIMQAMFYYDLMIAEKKSLIDCKDLTPYNYLNSVEQGIAIQAGLKYLQQLALKLKSL